MMAKPMPVIFFGHGNPLNALYDNAYTRLGGDRHVDAAAEGNTLRFGPLVHTASWP